MELMFWAHHVVVVIMSTALSFAAPDQWLIATFVGGTMEAGSFGYDLFIVASNPLGTARHVYTVIMSASHIVVLLGVLAWGWQSHLPVGWIYYVFMPVIVVFVTLRQKACASLIQDEEHRKALSNSPDLRPS